MNRMKRLLKISALILAVVCCVEVGAARSPNIILIMADDMGYECIGANGGTSYSTPNIDQLSVQGMRFEQCHANPACTPSRVQIMTGRYNVYNYTRFAQLKRGERTFAHLLKEAGYATCIVGKWQLGQTHDAPRHFGFDQSLLWQHTRSNFSNETQTDTRYENPQLERNGTEEDYHNGEFGPDLLVDYIGQFIKENKDSPFLVYYPMLLPHSPFVPNPDSRDWNPKSSGAKRGSMDTDYFDDMVHYTDKMLGRVVAQVEAAGLSEQTYIIFTADNGSLGNTVSQIAGHGVRGGKGQTTNAGTHVPLIVKGPGITGGTVNAGLIDFSDFLPTFCEIAGITPDQKAGFNGRSFFPQLKGELGAPRKLSYCWYAIPKFMEKKYPNISDISWARSTRYKLYRNGDFYDLSADLLETTPLKEDLSDNELTKLREVMAKLIKEHDAARIK